MKPLKKFKFSQTRPKFSTSFTCICAVELTAHVVVVTRPLLRDGGMVENHGAPKAGKLPRALTRVRRETENRHRASGAKSP